MKYDRAVKCLTMDRVDRQAFYDFPTEHWKQIRTSNRIESTFPTIRHRTTKKGLPEPPNCAGDDAPVDAVGQKRQLMLSAKKK